MQPTLGDARSILDKQEAYVEELMANNGVTAVGVAWRNEVLCFVVGVRDKTVKLDLPQIVEGLPVVKEVTCITVNGPQEPIAEESFLLSKILWIGLSVLTVIVVLVVLKTAP